MENSSEINTRIISFILYIPNLDKPEKKRNRTQIYADLADKKNGLEKYFVF